MMQVVCAWCKRDMGEKLGPDGLITHGICSDCVKEVLAKKETRFDVAAALLPPDTQHWPDNHRDGLD